MSFIDGVVDVLSGAFSKIAQDENKDIQSYTQSQRYRDYYRKGDSFSVECEISEALADLMLLQSSMPISGDTERAIWLDDVSDYFFRNKAKTAVCTAFETGDCIIVPSLPYCGRSSQIHRLAILRVRDRRLHHRSVLDWKEHPERHSRGG